MAVVLCVDGAEFESLPVPAIAWCAEGGRPRLGPDDRWVSASGAAGAWRHLPLPVADSLYEAGDGSVAVIQHDAEPWRVEHRGLAALAAGRLVVSETLGRGLEPGIDYLEVRAPEELHTAAQTVSRRPLAFERMRLRGRAKAEAFRASALMGRAAVDLLLELGRR